MRKSPPATGRRPADVIEILALAGAAALIVLPAWRNIRRRWRVRNPQARSERAIDASLDATYPASDPPAARYVDIPVNRR